MNVTDNLNPLLVKDVRSRMRGVRSFLMLSLFLLLAGGISYLTYLSTASVSAYDFALVSSGRIGQAVLAALLVTSQILVLLIVPMLTVSAVSGEVERKTYDMLLATPLAPRQIVNGKIGGALAFVALLLFGLLPLVSIASFFGGFTLADFGNGLLVLLLTAVCVALLGLAASALLRRTALAVLATYGTILLLTLVHMFVVVTGASLVNPNHAPPAWWFIFNPVVAQLSSMGLIHDNTFLLAGGRPVWYGYLLFALALSLFAYIVAWRTVRQRQRWRFARRDWLVVGIALLILVIASAWFVVSGSGQAQVASPATAKPTAVPAPMYAKPMPTRLPAYGATAGTPVAVTPLPLPTLKP